MLSLSLLSNTTFAAPEKNLVVVQNETEVVEKYFYVTPIDDELFARIKGKSFKDDCTLPREDLRYLHVLHKDLDGNTREGELICNVQSSIT